MKTGVRHKADLRLGLDLDLDGTFVRTTTVEAADWSPKMARWLGLLDRDTLDAVLRLLG